jgi:SAM-dependent methyltransferase
MGRVNARFARIVVLVSGAAILVVETLATRLVAPYVGLTLESTTAVIGVALAGIAVGAALGGRWADTLPPRRVAAGALAVGGLGVLAVRPLVRLLGPVLGPGPVAAILLVAASTLVSVTALAMVTPAITRARLTGLDGSGSVIGDLSAAGTVGSLAGTFLTGFVLVAFLPVTAILLVTGRRVPGPRPRRVGGGPPRGAEGRGRRAGAGRRARRRAGPVRHRHRLLLRARRARPAADERAGAGARRPAPLLRGPGRPHPPGVRLHPAVRRGRRRRVPRGRPLRAVHVGGGGFTMPRWLAATRPGSTSTVLEVDAGVVDLGRRELGVDAIPDLDVRLGDARTTLATLPTASADLVVGDAFGARSVPWHLATTEFVDEVRRVLRPGGLYVLNVIDRDPLALLSAVTATVGERFVHATLVIRPDQLEPGGGGNAVLAASDTPPDLAALRAAAAARGEPGSVLDEAATRAFGRGAPVLTDDRAPVDQLQT